MFNTAISRKRLAALVGVAALAITLSGCQGSSESGGGGDQPVVGSVLYGVDGYQTAHGKAMEAYGKSIGVTVRTCNSKNEVGTQNKCMQDLIAAGVDAIVMQPIDPAAATAMVKQAQGAAIPVVTWAVGPVPDVEVPFVDLAEYDQAFEAGATAAKWVKENLNQTPQIVDLGVPKNTNCENRENGFIEGAKDADPTTKVVAQPNGGGARVVSQKAMSDIIQSGIDFNIVTGCNGESTIGGLLALQAAGRGLAVD
jgi:ABC-type sugar transport system substrate-binding protein